MRFDKLFRVLVIGGAAAAGTTGCGGSSQQKTNTANAPATQQTAPEKHVTPSVDTQPTGGGGGAQGW